MFKGGASSSSLNSTRSALSFFLCYDFKLSDDITLAKLFKFFYRKRPLKAKYFTYWPVKKFLDHLAEIHPPSELTLKQLTLKTLSLVALTSSDRGQTLKLMDMENIIKTDDSISFVIFDRLKHTRRVLKPKTITCVSSDVPGLNVMEYVSVYLERTKSIRESHIAEGRPKPTKLFLSWLTKREVTAQTLSRWLKTSLDQAGIDTKQFTAHSIRGAGLSAAFNKGGANIQQIINAGSWSNTGTFMKHYLAPECNSAVGKIILQQFNAG